MEENTTMENQTNVENNNQEVNTPVENSTVSEQPVQDVQEAVQEVEEQPVANTEQPEQVIDLGDPTIKLPNNFVEPEVASADPALQNSLSAITQQIEELKNQQSSNEEDDKEDRWVSKNEFDQAVEKIRSSILGEIGKNQQDVLRAQQTNQISQKLTEKYLDDVEDGLQRNGIKINSPEGTMLAELSETKMRELILRARAIRGDVPLTAQDVAEISRVHWAEFQPLVRQIVRPKGNSQLQPTLSPAAQGNATNDPKPANSEKVRQEYFQKRQEGKISAADAIKMLNAK